MEATLFRWDPTGGWSADLGRRDESTALVLAFGSRAALEDGAAAAQLRSAFPNAVVAGCSTAGEISGTQFSEGSITAVSVRFSRVGVHGGLVTLGSSRDAFDAGKRLAAGLDWRDLRHVLVFSTGLDINGSALVHGVESSLPANVSVTGGLAGDGEAFERTCVLWGEKTAEDAVAAVGFYGDALRVGYGSVGGWDPFGPERIVTKSQGNVLYELDNMSALDLYKRYLGDHARGLPAAALLFPLAVRSRGADGSLVRTVLGVDDEQKTMTFAGDVPEGAYARFMKTNFNRIIDGAAGAANAATPPFGDAGASLAVLISCVGRKMVLRQRTEEELEAVRDALGAGVALTGFYSYGEISPLSSSGRSELHNQTMTITAFGEVDA